MYSWAYIPTKHASVHEHACVWTHSKCTHATKPSTACFCKQTCSHMISSSPARGSGAHRNSLRRDNWSAELWLVNSGESKAPQNDPKRRASRERLEGEMRRAEMIYDVTRSNATHVGRARPAERTPRALEYVKCHRRRGDAAARAPLTRGGAGLSL